MAVNFRCDACGSRLVSLQVSVLEDLKKAGRKVCVANTHLYWHPKGRGTPSRGKTFTFLSKKTHF